MGQGKHTTGGHTTTASGSAHATSGSKKGHWKGKKGQKPGAAAGR